MSELVALGSLAVLVYTYFGYPLVLLLMSRRETHETPGYAPRVSVLLAAHDEEAVIARTLHSVLESDYPKERLELVVCSDASVDRTDEIVGSAVAADPRVTAARLDVRSGKAAAIEKALRSASADVLVMIDASSVLRPDAIARLVRHFSSPSVGSVVGVKRVVSAATAMSRGDGLYWRYESGLRRLESRTGASWVGVEGGLFAIRRDALDLDFASDIATDYAIGCRVYEQGYRNVYEPAAVAEEPGSPGLTSEARRKVRVIVRGIRAFIMYRHLLNPFEHPRFAFQNYSHRLLRWLAPFFLIALLIASSLSDSPAVRLLFGLQIAFYGLAALGGVASAIGFRARGLSAPLYFTSMNAMALLSWFQVFRRFDVWEPTPRDTSTISPDGGA